MSKNNKIGLLEAISMAVGTMIGASIFSIFGIGTKIAGRNLPEAFILSGIFALLVAYSYSKLGSKIVSNAGPIAFILEGIGDNLLTGALAILMWLSYVVSISLFAKGFAGYFLPLVGIGVSPLSMGITEVFLIAFFTAINSFGSKAVGRLEFYIVIIKLSILGVFILFGFLQIHPDFIVPSFNRQHLHGTLYASVIFFLSYMGFGLITNASENMENPKKNVPLAIYISIAVVMFVYISVSLVAVGNLSISALIKAQDNALAVAAKPFLGSFGFILISVGALFSISSALNATLYGGANVAYSFAKDGDLPEFFERKVWSKSTEGLYVTAALGLLFVLIFNIGAIASITSVIFTIIYIFVLISHYRLADDYGGNKGFIILNIIILLIVFLVLIFYQWQTQKGAFLGMIITLLGAVSLEYIYRYTKKRKFTK
ncbi:MAG TPA: amino acid permease [Nitrospirae bacterium]|nr:amino acid permease [Nitrospirota bacterium]HDZ88455.1 amino acid permease [Nitrospirota bacterium]